MFRGALLRRTLFATLLVTGVQGGCYNVGRAIGAFFPTAVGFQAGRRGRGNTLICGAVGYAIAMVALLRLPETRGSHLHLRHQSDVRTAPSSTTTSRVAGSCLNFGAFFAFYCGSSARHPGHSSQ